MSDDSGSELAPKVLTTYARLTERFAAEEHKTLAARGGQTYVPWNLVAGRLNDVLGVTGWSFEIIREGFTQNECWVLGRLNATVDGETTIRDQYGCADVMLGQFPNTDLLKKAGTDALKKCAQVLGVALYLTDAEERAEVKREQEAQKRGQGRPAARTTPDVQKSAQVTGAPPQPALCDKKQVLRTWHAAVKGTHLEDDATRAAFISWYSDKATDSLSTWFNDATVEEAETLILTAKERIALKTQKASA